MSLFENDEYQWRETYFILFDQQNRPTAQDVEKLLDTINNNYQVRDVRENEEGTFESLTLLSPDDYAAMDLSCMASEDLGEQLTELAEELKSTASEDELDTIKKIPLYTARMEVYHFEQLVFVGGPDDEPDDFMDPGSLLVVLEKLAEICQGIVVDPQSNSLL